MYRTRARRGSIDLGGLTELRVHGVGGSAPEQFLNVPYTDHVAGDLTAGFFAAPDDPARQPRRRLEAYSWGGLTSRSRLRALWLLLLPFALVNLAGWMADRGRTAAEMTAAGDDRSAIPGASRVSVATLRIVGLVVTAAAVLYFAVAGIDLYGYQCGSTGCAAPGRWLTWPLTTGWAAASLGRRLVVGAALPLLVTGVVAFITKRSQTFIHPGVDTDPAAAPLDPVHTHGLTDRGFWRSPQVAHRLGLTHTAAAFAVTGHVLASVGEAVPGLGIAGWWRPVFISILVAAGAGVLLLGRLRARWYNALLAASIVAVAAVIVLLVGADAAALAGQAPGARRLAVPLAWLTVAGVAVFAAGQLGAVRTLTMGSRPRRLFNALAPVALVLAGTGLVNAVGSGMLVQIANLLGDGMARAQWEAGEATGEAMVYTDFVGATAVVTVMTLAAVVLAAAAMALWEYLRRDRPDAVAAAYAAAGLPVDLSDPTTRSLLRRVGMARAVASLTDRVAAVIGIAMIAGVVLTLWALLDPQFPRRFGPAVQQAASTVLALLPLAGIFVINRSSRSPGVRRGIGILWDIATFWPRWFHPFAPPPYGERAVPQLAQRLDAILDSGGTVVLSAHSQGSVVGAAAIAVLDARRPDGMSGVTFLTHGSPLGRLYARFFRRYFDDDLLRRVAATVSSGDRPGWVNLHRRTDFIGGAVFTEATPGYVDREILDPPELTLVPGQMPPRPRSHFNYTDDAAYDTALLGLVGPPPPPVTPGP